MAASAISTLRAVSQDHGFVVHAYCFMPDHVHLLVCGTKDGSNALAFIRDFKHRTAGVARGAGKEHLWQKKFYDHILRRPEGVDSVAAYIWMNPVRKGLCERPEEYPLSGSLTLDWERVRKVGKHLATWQPPWKMPS